MRDTWKPLRIFDYSWHVAHAYSLMTALPFTEFYIYEPPTRRWAEESRPFPTNARFVPFYNEGKYDVAILHVDGECADPEGKKGDLYKKLNELIKDIPKIVINHGTPYIPERFGKYFKKVEDEKKQFDLGVQFAKNEMKKLMGSNEMVVNSKKSASDWGFGTPIVHGIANNPLEQYWDLPKDPIVLFNVSVSGWPYYYNRAYMEDVRTRLIEQGINVTHMRVDYTPRNFDDYRNFIGRSLIGLYPFRESPMPRSRTEHMLSGGCVVTSPTHDMGELFKGLEFKKTEAGKFIKTETGDLIPATPIEEAEVVFCDIDNPIDGFEKVLWLYRNPDIAVKIGQNGKKKAMQVFDVELYKHQWFEMFKKVGAFK